MSKCPFCGKELPSDDLWYCPYCGSRLRDASGNRLFPVTQPPSDQTSQQSAPASTPEPGSGSAPAPAPEPVTVPPSNQEVSRPGSQGGKRWHDYFKEAFQELTKRERLLWFLIIFEFLVIATMIGAGQPVPTSQATGLVKSLNASIPYSSGKEAIALSIFKNNYYLALLMDIPLAGPVMATYVSFNTGYMMSAQAIVYSNQTSVAFTGTDRFLSLMVLPIFWLEFVCYTAAVLESLYLLVSLFTKRFTKELFTAIIVIVGITIILFISAQLEAFAYV
ncbi:MAG: hypothetical protein ACP5T5_01100 [Thermoprotei archaeon]|nr:hypothetical protein [TACK group archaeon]